MKYYKRTSPGIEAIRNLREAWKFLCECRNNKESAGTGARADAREWLEEAVKEVLRTHRQ